MDAVYTTEALSTGAGRDGRSVVKDSDLDFTMTAPKEMGGSGEGANPEQLFVLTGMMGAYPNRPPNSATS